MFAGLPGIGVGTLFYVLTALWMPLRECRFVFKGQSSLRRWRLIAVQCGFAISIIACVAAADRTLVWLLGAAAPASVGPARLLNDELAARSTQSIVAAPVTASILLLVGVLLTVELHRVFNSLKRRWLPRVHIPTPCPTEILIPSAGLPSLADAAPRQ